jgi:hypothetical protein
LLCYRGISCADARKRTVHNPDGSTSRARIPARATEPGLLCRMDTTMTRAAIEQMPMDYLELGTLLGKTVTIDLPTSGTRELPVPIRLGVDMFADLILDELERWAEVVAENAGFWYYPSGGRHDRVRCAAGWLIGRYERLLKLPATWHQRLDPTNPCVSGVDSVTYTLEAGIDGALRLLALHEQTVGIAGRTRRAERLHSFCPRCHLLALEHDEGSSHVDCRRCKYRMTLDDYDKLAGALAAGYETSPRARPEPSARTTERIEDAPIVWADGTEHGRDDVGSNVMLSYLARHDDRQGAVA